MHAGLQMVGTKLIYLMFFLIFFFFISVPTYVKEDIWYESCISHDALSANTCTRKVSELKYNEHLLYTSITPSVSSTEHKNA